jgi:hypothetical protein
MMWWRLFPKNLLELKLPMGFDMVAAHGFDRFEPCSAIRQNG